MEHRSKSGWKIRRHEVKQRWKRSAKRKHAALIESGVIKKGTAPVSPEA